jgi:hypothetical protein
MMNAFRAYIANAKVVSTDVATDSLSSQCANYIAYPLKERCLYDLQSDLMKTCRDGTHLESCGGSYKNVFTEKNT